MTSFSFSHDIRDIVVKAPSHAASNSLRSAVIEADIVLCHSAAGRGDETKTNTS